MITVPYDLDIFEEAFDIVLKLDLTFKILVNAKARCSKCDRYGHYDISAPQRVNMFELCLLRMLIIQRLLRMSMFLP